MNEAVMYKNNTTDIVVRYLLEMTQYQREQPLDLINCDDCAGTGWFRGVRLCPACRGVGLVDAKRPPPKVAIRVLYPYYYKKNDI